MDFVPLLCAVAVAFTGLTRGAGVLPDAPLNAAVGETVMFNTTVTPPETPFILVHWKCGDNNIVVFNVYNITGPEYEGRITLFLSTGSLELRNLALNDSGEYSVSIFPSGEPPKEGRTRLVVHEILPNPIATASSTDLEEDSSVRLSCSSSGSSLSFLWLNGSSEVTASDRVQLTDGGSTLTMNVTRYDQGPFRCHVTNPVSNATSDPIHLSISYGPENMNLIIYPPQEYYKEGSNVSMVCSADSRPAAHVTWLLNGDLQSGTGAVLRLMNIQESQSGNYSCRAFNSKTLINKTSLSSVVSILEIVSNVTATASSTDLEQDSSVRLSCSSSGSSLSFLWINGSSEVTASDRVQLTDGGSTLTMNVTRYDLGPFICHVTNPVSNATSDQIHLSISYGPENMNLIIYPPQEYYKEGSNVSMVCSADSRPAAHVTWLLNGDLQSGTGAVLRLMNIQESQSGNYSCQAFNSKTLINKTSLSSVVSILDIVSNVTATASRTDLEEDSSVRLSCSSSGSSLSFLWLNGSSEVTASDRVQLTDGNSTLTMNVTLYDQGPFRCYVTNPVSNAISDPIHLSISYILRQDKCSDGCIAGIVIAVLAVCAGLGGAWYMYYTKKLKHTLSVRNPPTVTGAEGQDNNAYAGTQEVKYADISIFQKANGGTVHLGSQSNSEYAEIRVNDNPPEASSPPTCDAHQQRMKKPAPQPPPDPAQLYAQVHKK